MSATSITISIPTLAALALLGLNGVALAQSSSPDQPRPSSATEPRQLAPADRERPGVRPQRSAEERRRIREEMGEAARKTYGRERGR